MGLAALAAMVAGSVLVVPGTDSTERFAWSMALVRGSGATSLRERDYAGLRDAEAVLADVQAEGIIGEPAVRLGPLVLTRTDRLRLVCTWTPEARNEPGHGANEGDLFTRYREELATGLDTRSDSRRLGDLLRTDQTERTRPSRGNVLNGLRALAFITLLGTAAWLWTRPTPLERRLRSLLAKRCPACGYNLVPLRRNACYRCAAVFSFEEIKLINQRPAKPTRT